MTRRRQPGCSGEGSPRRAALGIVAVAVVLGAGACASSTPDAAPGAATSGPAVTANPTAQPSPSPRTSPAGLAERCGVPARAYRQLLLRTADGDKLPAAVLGHGPRGVVLLHESGGRALCGWWPDAVQLQQAGMHVLLFDLPCYGEATCRNAKDAGPAVRAAAAELHRSGASSLALVGASLGASLAVIEGTDPRVGATAVVALSPDQDSEALAAPTGTPDTAIRSAGRLRRPLLAVVAGTGDRYVDVSAVRQLVRAATSARASLWLAPVDAGHGWDMVDGGLGQPTAVGNRVASWLLAHQPA